MQFSYFIYHIYMDYSYTVKGGLHIASEPGRLEAGSERIAALSPPGQILEREKKRKEKG